jgi:hypothetical protein
MVFIFYLESAMPIYELWIETTQDYKYIGHYERIPPEKSNQNFSTASLDSPMAAAQAVRVELRKLQSPNDQYRVRNRINIYENVNDALEDMLRN